MQKEIKRRGKIKEHSDMVARQLFQNKCCERAVKKRIEPHQLDLTITTSLNTPEHLSAEFRREVRMQIGQDEIVVASTEFRDHKGKNPISEVPKLTNFRKNTQTRLWSRNHCRTDFRSRTKAMSLSNPGPAQLPWWLTKVRVS